MSRHFFTDTATASLQYAGDGDLTVDDEPAPSEAETVTLDSHWNDFFGTDEYVQFRATVAKPIEQPYIHDGELKTFKKDKNELQRVQAQIDNLPWTKGHPSGNRVHTASQIDGFWNNPQYNDGQRATLHIPANDPDSVRFAATNDEVSVGFGAQLDWLDAGDVDAVQRDMAYDHIASVETGRCSRDDGCGLHTDNHSAHGHVVDAVRTQMVEDPAHNDFSVDDWVSFMSSGNRRHGQISSIDDDTATVTLYDTDTEQLSEETTTVSLQSLSQWVGPHVDSCPGDYCSCGCHVMTDAPDGIYVEGGDWYGVAPDENADDEPKYDLNNCNDVKDAFNLRNNGDYDIATETLVSRIERAAQAHNCPAEFKPWIDSARQLASFIQKHDKH